MADEKTVDFEQFTKDFLGIDLKDIDSNDKLQEAFNSNFIKRSAVREDDELVNSIVGQRFGSLETEIRKIAKKNDVELGEDAKDKKVEDLIPLAFDKIREAHTSKYEELKSRIENNDVDEITKTWEDKYSKLESKYKDTKGLLDQTKNQMQEVESNYKNKLNQVQVDVVHNQALGAVPWQEKLPEVSRKGYEAHMKENFRIEFDSDEKKAYPVDKEGRRIPNPAKAGEFMGVEELYKTEAVKLGVANVANNKGGGGDDKDRKKQTFERREESKGGDGPQRRRLSSAARRAEGGE